MKILLSGFTSGGTIKKILKEEKFDKIVLFASDKFVKNAESFLKSNKLNGKVRKINAFDIEPLMLVIGNEIFGVMKHEILVNITEGTNLMAAAFLCSSYYYGLKTVVVIEDGKGVIELPIISLKETRYLTPSAEEWLIKIKKMSRNGSISQKDLAAGISAQRLSNPLRILEKAGFIEMKNITLKVLKTEDEETGYLDEGEERVNRRSKEIKLTALGNLYSKFMIGRE